MHYKIYRYKSIYRMVGKFIYYILLLCETKKTCLYIYSEIVYGVMLCGLIIESLKHIKLKYV